MLTQVLWLSTMLLGINAGWQPLPDGEGMEYIIQIDPQTLEALKAGETLQSDIPPDAGNVRTYKIVLGTKTLPRINAPAAAEKSPPLNSAVPNPPATADANAGTESDRQSSSPGSLLPDPAGKQITQSAAYVAEKNGESKSAPEGGKENATVQKDQPAKPWLPLILTTLALFASLGGNVYLAMLFTDLRRRYKSLIGKSDV